jgi:exodeoxyribonuclease VII small subunit
MSTPSESTPTFEASLSELEGLVARMEQGELSLNESLTEFERGMALVSHCEAALRDAELKVAGLLKARAQSSASRLES